MVRANTKSVSGGGGRFNYRKKGRGVILTLRGNQRGNLAYLMPVELIIIDDRSSWPPSGIKVIESTTIDLFWFA